MTRRKPVAQPVGLAEAQRLSRLVNVAVLASQTVIGEAAPPRRRIGARRFVLQRNSDVSGTSGTGEVAEGVMFSGGRVAMTWHSHFGTVSVYDNMQVVEHLHGHEGATVVVWVDR